MVAADHRVVPVSADPISSCSAIELQSARPGCMHTAPRRNKISRSLSGYIFSFYTDRHWTNMSAFQKSIEVSALLKCISAGCICKSVRACTAKTCEGWLRDGAAFPAGFYFGFLFLLPRICKKTTTKLPVIYIFIVFSCHRSCLRLDTQNEFFGQKLIEQKSIIFRKPKLGRRNGYLQCAIGTQITFQRRRYLQFTAELTCKTAAFTSKICFNFFKRFCK